MTPLERAQLRVKCVEVFVMAASRAGIEKGEVFALGERLFVFATYTPPEESSAKAMKKPA